MLLAKNDNKNLPNIFCICPVFRCIAGQVRHTIFSVRLKMDSPTSNFAGNTMKGSTMKTFITASFVIFLLLIFIPVGYAGWESSYGSKTYKFTYEVEGEIEVEPDTAVLPLMITVSAKSYSDALNQAKKLLNGFNQEIKALGSDVFSATPTDFFKPQRGGRKSLDLSFFRSGDDKSQAMLVFNVYAAFKSNHDFWERAAFMAQANDFIASIENRYKKNEKIIISPN
jgi:hypothetical protein